MPLQTKLLWAENGLLRKTNLFHVDRPREIELRTKMLQLHQKLALGTLGLMFAQGYLGFQLQDATTNYMELSDRHAALGMVAFGFYLTSAMLSIQRLQHCAITKKLIQSGFIGGCQLSILQE